jgi:hypothetical protein
MDGHVPKDFEVSMVPMQRNSLVLTQLRKSSEYNDFVGQFYHFPDKYVGQFKTLPIEFVYYEGPENGKGVYFGYGKIVSPPAKDKRELGYSFAEIIDYKPFLEPVPFKNTAGKGRESASPHYNPQNAVRKISAEILDEICLDGKIRLNFRADAHLIRVLGEQLIASEKVGILELINSCATLISFSPRRPVKAMLIKDPLKQILANTRSTWDVPQTRTAVRKNFAKVLKCRTAALGSEVYASETEQKLVYHTCKSRACPSCGHRATTIWQREQHASLPDIPYVEVVFTMPDVLWPIFQTNRDLLNDMPALGAAVIQQWAKEKSGTRVIVMVVQHTFGRHLNFNPHLHILVSAGGLREPEASWSATLPFDNNALMRRWRYALITYLRAALKAGLLTSPLGVTELKRIFTTQYERWWSSHISHFKSKGRFLQYAGRYVRRPPIAQYRFVEVNDRHVQFRTNDHRQKREVLTSYKIEEFVRTLADHVPDHYHHGVRYFGLLAPRSKARTAPFALLGQNKSPRPARLSWDYSIEKSFGKNPLVDCTGQRMRLIGRRKPILEDSTSGCAT